jgi:hypothetical protein
MLPPIFSLLCHVPTIAIFLGILGLVVTVILEAVNASIGVAIFMGCILASIRVAIFMGCILAWQDALPLEFVVQGLCESLMSVHYSIPLDTIRR